MWRAVSPQGGFEVPHGRFPYMTSIKSTTGHLHHCGGILISPTVVMTVAHCLKEVGPHPHVHIGSDDVNDEDTIEGVKVSVFLSSGAPQCCCDSRYGKSLNQEGQI